MKAMKLTALATLSIFAMTAHAGVGESLSNASKSAKPAAVSLELGTLGYGANVAWSANDSTELVVGWSGMNVDSDIDIGGNDSVINWKKVLGSEYENFEGNLKLGVDFNNPYVGVNVRPFANRFTVGSGVIFQRNKLDATLTSKGEATEVTFNGTDYPIPAGSDINIHAESSRSLAPYLTIGFKPNADKRFGMFGELGAVYTGKWKTSVDVSESIPDYEELEKDMTDKINGDNLSWYPIIKLGATYRF